MKTYLVIGSNCFTGSHIVDALLARDECRVIGVSRSPEYASMFLPYKQWDTRSFQFRQLDIVRDFDALSTLLDEARPAVVINVAALGEVAASHGHPVEYFETNMVGVVRLCHFLRTRSYLKRYVHFSSAAIFGACEAPVGEEARFYPCTPYAVSKAAADMYINMLVRDFGFPATLIRPTAIYGKYQQLYKLIPRTIIYLRLGRLIKLHGGGRTIESFVHIRDVVDGLLLALEHGRPGAYHFSVESADTVADVVRHICQRLGYDFERFTREVDARPGQGGRYWLDCTKARRELGWAPRVPFDDGVREVVEWIEQNWATIQHAPLEYVHKA